MVSAHDADDILGTILDEEEFEFDDPPHPSPPPPHPKSSPHVVDVLHHHRQGASKRSRADDMDYEVTNAARDDEDGECDPGEMTTAAALAADTTLHEDVHDADVDVDMRDDATFVPLEGKEVSLVEHICRVIVEPKKHLVRLLVKQFGASMAQGVLNETIATERKGGSFFDIPGRPRPQRRSPGGVFIDIFKRRAPEADVKRVLEQSKEIDKVLKKQREALDRRRDGGARAGAKKHKT